MRKPPRSIKPKVMFRYQVSLDHQTVRAAQKIGEGNLSAGIRKSVFEAVRVMK